MENTVAPDSLPFMKMHGAGNDFVIIDSRNRGAMMTNALARAIGDRHFGVGFDQLAELHSSTDAGCSVDFWNSDGSRAGACGNATRCIADNLMTELGLSEVYLRTDRGNLQAVRGANGLISVNMGKPQLDWKKIPLARECDTLHLPLENDPVAVGMGNPHCVFFVDEVSLVDVAGIGSEIECNPLFPERTNVEFAQVSSRKFIRLRVWERGALITLACGSGACATVVAAHLRGLTEKRVELTVDGGTLIVDWRDDGVWLSGPTAFVFESSLSAEFLKTI
ncbi:MAG: diaminopimelate epimerase [Paracoccaceae bacterium]